MFRNSPFAAGRRYLAACGGATPPKTLRHVCRGSKRAAALRDRRRLVLPRNRTPPAGPVVRSTRLARLAGIGQPNAFIKMPAAGAAYTTASQQRLRTPARWQRAYTEPEGYIRRSRNSPRNNRRRKRRG